MSSNAQLGYVLIAAAAWAIVYGLWYGIIKRRIRGFGGEFTGADAVVRGFTSIALGVLVAAVVIAKMAQGRW